MYMYIVYNVIGPLIGVLKFNQCIIHKPWRGAPNIWTAQYSDNLNSFPESPLFRRPNIPTPQYSDTKIPTILTPQYSDTFTICVLIAALGLGLGL